MNARCHKSSACPRRSQCPHEPEAVPSREKYPNEGNTLALAAGNGFRRQRLCKASVAFMTDTAAAAAAAAASASTAGAQPIPITALPAQSLQQVAEALAREVERLSQALQQLSQASQRWSLCRATVEKWERQVRSVEDSSKEADGSVPRLTDGDEVLLPLTGSAFVSGQVCEPETCLVDIGTGYSVQKTPAEARAYFDGKLKVVNEHARQASAALEEKRKQWEVVNQVLAAKLQGSGAARER